MRGFFYLQFRWLGEGEKTADYRFFDTSVLDGVGRVSLGRRGAMAVLFSAFSRNGRKSGDKPL